MSEPQFDSISILKHCLVGVSLVYDCPLSLELITGMFYMRCEGTE